MQSNDIGIFTICPPQFYMLLQIWRNFQPRLRWPDRFDLLRDDWNFLYTNTMQNDLVIIFFYLQQMPIWLIERSRDSPIPNEEEKIRFAQAPARRVSFILNRSSDTLNTKKEYWNENEKNDTNERGAMHLTHIFVRFLIHAHRHNVFLINKSMINIISLPIWQLWTIIFNGS